MSKAKEKTLTLSQRHLEEFLNRDEDATDQLVQFGILSPEEAQLYKDADEKLRVVIEDDEELAASIDEGIKNGADRRETFVKAGLEYALEDGNDDE